MLLIGVYVRTIGGILGRNFGNLLYPSRYINISLLYIHIYMYLSP